MTYQEYRLGDICRLVKGTFSSTKTLPGEYPLVVTAAQRRTADGFDLEGPAVCIPLISSTGHGDAAIHRLHYQEGPFALANLLVALIPLPDSPANAEYLYWYLTAKKDEVLVPLMRGTANVSLKEKDIAEVYVPLPPLPEQQRIVARVKGLLDKVEEARRLREAQALHISLYNDASFAQLLEPQADWNQTTVDEVIESVDAGWSPQCESQPAKADEWGILRTTAVQWREFRSHENKRLPLGLSGRPELAVLQGDVLVTRAGPRKRVGVVCIVPESALQLMISDKLIRLRPKVDLILPDFLALSLSSPYSQEYLVQRKTGLADAQVNISQKILLNTPLAFPDLARQRNILEVWQQRQQREGELASTLQKSSDELQALPSSILAQAFAGAL